MECETRRFNPGACPFDPGARESIAFSIGLISINIEAALISLSLHIRKKRGENKIKKDEFIHFDLSLFVENIFFLSLNF